MRRFQSATVYTENVVNGLYDIPAGTITKLRVKHIGGAQTISDRQELGQYRHLMWEGSYLMPDDCVVLVGSERYRPIDGTFRTIRGMGGNIRNRAVDAIEVKSEDV